MNVSQISAFQAVMTSASLSDAARKLGRTQPAVSAAIKSLEDQLGVRLFNREGRKLVPVPEAQYLLAETGAILSQLTRVKQTMKALADGQTGSLNVAAMPGPVATLFPRFIAGQIGQDAGISVSILARSSSQIAELARAQSIDFGFADAPEQDGAETLYTAEIISAESSVAIPVGHPLAAFDEISLADLHTERLGSLQASHAYQRDISGRFDRQGLTQSLMVESQTFLPILQFVSSGLCCSIIDPLTVAHVNSAPDLASAVKIARLDQPIRYRYAIFEPSYRPMSVLASQVKQSWRSEVLELLETLGANPKIEPPSQRRLESMSL